MDAVIGGLLLAMLVLGFGPATRGTKAAFDSFDDPHRPETQEERERANSDMLRLLVLLVGVFALLFVMKMGG